jgi:hypothetical protein
VDNEKLLDEIPENSRFKGYQERVIQDITFQTHNICYRLAEYTTPEVGLMSGFVVSPFSLSISCSNLSICFCCQASTSNSTSTSGVGEYPYYTKISSIYDLNLNILISWT